MKTRRRSSFRHSCRWMVPMRTPKCSRTSSSDRSGHRACRARSQRRSHRSPGNADAPNWRSHIAKSRVERWVGCGPGYPGVGPGRVPLTRSIPCAPRKPSSSTSSGSRRSSASPSTSADTPGRSGIAASSGTTSSTPASATDVREHFLGPIMYVAAVDPLNAHWAPFMVYDGQQRLTTITLILKALSRHLKDDDRAGRLRARPDRERVSRQPLRQG